MGNAPFYLNGLVTNTSLVNRLLKILTTPMKDSANLNVLQFDVELPLCMQLLLKGERHKSESEFQTLPLHAKQLYFQPKKTANKQETAYCQNPTTHS